ncbi:CRISPR-associated endonuclease Cas3'' [Streptomyces sp. NPDC057136]|uniref:CRISPR-associated endonuclease Cas3'' n=1 Tax=Streptomyces sp. NPDC057136 TaxID=3346029 RepID=UPI0036393935
MIKRDEAGASGDCLLDVRLWGKESGLSRPYPVMCHLLDTGAVFRELWDVVLGDETKAAIADALGLSVAEARMVVSFWAGLHDIGKITPPFQAQVPVCYKPVRDDPAYVCAPGAEGEKSFRHEIASHWALYQLFEEAGYPGGERLVHKSVSHQVALLGGHHGLFGGVLKAKEAARASDYNPGLGKHGRDGQRRVHFEELRRAMGAYAVPRGGLPAALGVVVSGLVVVADWLASQASAIEPRLPGPGWSGTAAEVDAHWHAAMKAAPGLVRAARVGRARFSIVEFGEMFPFAANSLQRDLAEHLPAMVGEHGPGLVLVTAPTGDGKTEAALFAASLLGRAAGARGLYFAPGGMLELWSAATGQRPSKVVGPLGPLGGSDSFTGDGFSFSFTGNDGEFYLATGNTVRFQQLPDPSHFETYSFAADQYFLAATKDGRTLLRTRSESGFGGNSGRGRLDLIHLDPELWKRHLCDVVGHDLTREERRGLPSGLPEAICPA